MSFKTIKKKSALEIVIKQIKNEIKNGNLNPGEKLPSERELSNQIGVSRTTVREAVKALSFSGYLKSIQGKGIYVLDTANKYDVIIDFFSKLSDYSLNELLEARAMLEGEFARMATIKANQEEIILLEKIFEEMNDTKNLNDFFVKDLAFHLTIADATHNPIMSGIMKILIEMIYKETRKIIATTKYTRDNTVRITRKLIQAIKQQNAEKAKELMAEHIRDVIVSLK